MGTHIGADEDRWPRFDLVKLAYPVRRYPLGTWLLRACRREVGPVPSLARLHEAVADLSQELLGDLLTHLASSPAMVRMVHALVRDHVAPLVEGEVLAQEVPFVRVLMPGQARGVVEMHTDVGRGHSPLQRNVWVPLTATQESNALHVLPLRHSRRQQPRPVAMVPGEALLFCPQHMHGSRMNSTETTRVSIDVRILPAHARRPRAPSFIALEKRR